MVDLGDRLDTFYAWAAYNTKLIGQFMGSALAKLVKKHGYTGEIHLFGRLFTEYDILVLRLNK